MKVTQITKPVCKDIIRGDALAALNKALEPFGLTAALGNITFTAGQAKSRVTFTLAGVDPGKDEFVRRCWKHGLKPDAFGSEFQFLGETYRIVGVTKSRKFPILAERSDGKRYKVPAAAVMQERPSERAMRLAKEKMAQGQ